MSIGLPAGATPTPAAAPPAAHMRAHRGSLRGIYWGANIGPQLTGGEAPWNTAAIPAFERRVGKRLSIDHMGWPFASCTPTWCTPYPFPAAGLSLIRADGAIPLVSWSTNVNQGSGNAKQFSLSSIANGEWDSWLRAYAAEVRAWGHPFFLRLDWEMNGNWYPYSPGQDGSTAAAYVAAWRHIHDVFSAAGARNVTWVWCPNIDYSDQLAQLYPGSKYVDWTCLDGYNEGDVGGSHFESFGQLYRASYDLITQRIAPNKPLMIGEFASSPDGGSKAAWISNALSVIPRQFPAIRAVVYFDRNDSGGDWAIETNAAAAAAFRAGIANPAYVTNRYAHLGGGVIRPPSARGRG